MLFFLNIRFNLSYLQTKQEARSLLKTIENNRTQQQRPANTGATTNTTSTTDSLSSATVDCNEVSMDESDMILPTTGGDDSSAMMLDSPSTNE